MLKLKKSEKLLKDAKKLIPALSQTFSKAPYSYVEGIYPSFLEKGRGSHVFDIDGNEYIDYVLGLGPIILGYNYPRVNHAIKKQLKNGIIFSMPHRLEVEVSKQISSMVPNADMVRFSKTGSDAGTATIRAARAITKREKIAYCGTGGVWHDWFTVLTSRNEGIPKIFLKMTRKFTYNDIESLKILFEDSKDDIAAVYIEPITLEYPKNNFLQKVKKLTHNNGAILIFDEVITGFRYSNGGAQEFLNIQADLAAFGKGIANGMPLGAITGKRKFMEKFNEIFYSTTYGGETLSLAAASAVLAELKEKPVVKHFWKIGNYFNKVFNKLADEIGVNIKLEGPSIRSIIVCRDEKNNPSLLYKSLFYQETIKRGILFGPGAVMFSYSHSNKDVKKTLKACEDSMKILKKAIETKKVSKLLKGKVMKPVLTF